MRLISCILATTCICLGVFAYAEDPKKVEPSRKPPKSGLLAVASVSGAGSRIVGEIFGDEDIFSKELPVISGSISRRGESSWRFSVTNNSKDRYSVSVDLVQRNENGSTVKFSSYSYTLSPGHSDGEEVQSGLNARRAELRLRSYRNLTPRASKDER
jgi:hypothetical protein